MKLKSVLLGSVFAFCAALSADAQNLLTNGDFETAPFASNNTVTAWAVSGTVVVLEAAEGATSPIHSAAFRPKGGVISQAVTTVAGKVYNVDFDAGTFGTKTGQVQVRVQAIGSSTLLDQTVDPPSASTTTPSQVTFQHYHFTFTADTTSTTLRFTDTRSGNAICDNVVDSVSVTAVAPSPTPTATPTASPTPTATPSATATPTPTATPTATPSGPSLLLNGDFETPPYAPNSTMTYWTVSGVGFIHSATEGATSPTHSAALSIGHDSEGTVLAQSFNTVVGTSYVLDFDSGIFGVRSGAALQLNVQVLGNGTLINDTVTPPDAGTFTGDAVTFQHYHYTFVANSTTSTVRFMDIGLGNANADTLIDSVSVVANKLANPNFELGNFNSVGVVTNWVVGGNQKIGQLAEGATTPTHAAAFNTGGDFAGNTLSQTVSTTNGQVYAVDFDAGIFGQRVGSALQLNVQAIGGSTLLNQTVTPTDAGTFDANAV